MEGYNKYWEDVQHVRDLRGWDEEDICKFLIQNGKNLSWKLLYSSKNKIRFQKKYFLFQGVSIIEVQSKGGGIFILTSESVYENIWSSTSQKKHNENNCKEYIKNIEKYLSVYMDTLDGKIITNKIETKEKEILIKINNLNSKIFKIIKELDENEDGEIDLVDGESFNKLLSKNQKSILEVDKNYIQKFVKISIYLKTKKNNTQKIFESISETKDDEELIELVNLLKNQIHTYELLVFHSINMITSLVDSDLTTFYEIYECFDQLGVFNSNWENEVSNKLTDIGDGIKDLMYSIYQMENKIVNSIDNLTYTTQESFMDLTNSVEKQLSSIDSSIKFNNLLTGIQTYQMYKINQNTKRIN